MHYHWLQFVGPSRTVEVFGVRLLGVDAANLHKLVLTLGLLIFLYLLTKLLRGITHLAGSRAGKKGAFWIRQGVSILTWIIAIVAVVSIWFGNNPTRLATGIGLIGAGLAFALQKVITSLAGYFVILRGKTFNVGDRITMGGVRGDVIALTFIQTVIMEMGQPPGTGSPDDDMWVKARQFSGRIVTVSNSKIFDEPVYNYTRDFPYIWEEIRIPVSYRDDRYAAEKILIDAANKHTVNIAELAAPAMKELHERFYIEAPDLKPTVYMRLTDNWVELTVRFLCADHKIRSVKNAMSREIIDAFDKAKIGIASGTYEIVGMPPLHVEMSPHPAPTTK